MGTIYRDCLLPMRLQTRQTFAETPSQPAQAGALSRRRFSRAPPNESRNGGADGADRCDHANRPPSSFVLRARGHCAINQASDDRSERKAGQAECDDARWMHERKHGTARELIGRERKRIGSRQTRTCLTVAMDDEHLHRTRPSRPAA